MREVRTVGAKREVGLWLVVLILLLGTIPVARGQQQITLSYWHHIHKPANDLEARLITEFESRSPGVRVQVTLIEDADLNTKLLTAMAGGAGPDIFNLFDGFFTSYVTSGFLAPVDLQVFQAPSYGDLTSRWLRGSLSGYTNRGKIYGIPSELSSYGFWINAKHFQESGLNADKDAPRTWEDVARVGQKLARFKGNTLVRKGYAQSWRFPVRYLIIFDAMLRQAGGQIFNAEGTQVLLPSQPTRTAPTRRRLGVLPSSCRLTSAIISTSASSTLAWDGLIPQRPRTTHTSSSGSRNCRKAVTLLGLYVWRRLRRSSAG